MVVSFNPGPSELPPAVRDDLAELARGDLLSASHRGEAVRAVVASARDGLLRAMGLPEGWQAVFTPSASAAMEVVLRGLVVRRSFHLVHGAFGERFLDQARRIGLEPAQLAGPPQDPLPWREAVVPDDTELVCVTHNETSTGSAWPRDELRELCEAQGERLLAVDVTSSFGALRLDWDRADVWFASVQKVLGLPAGLGLLLVGPRAEARARILAQRGRPHSPGGTQDLVGMLERMQSGETYETPNVLALALLDRRLRAWDLDAVEAATLAKGRLLERAGLDARWFVADPAWRSRTVHHLVVGDPEAWHARAAAAGFALGRGYGLHARDAVRIATFPSHDEAALAALCRALRG
ncbi:MAG: aminotransferase class V-fold PLP-dependent enzyme [Planctomycetota bacterium]